MKKRRWIKWTILSVLLLILLSVAGFFAWSMFTVMPADAEAAAYLQNADGLEIRGDFYLMFPNNPSGTGLVFYPGARVAEEAYLPLLEGLRQQGITCVLVKMPFRLAMLHADAAEEAMGMFPEIERWYVCGHSMGGAFASVFAENHPDSISGLILLAANLYGDYDPGKTLMVYGSLDELAQNMTHVEHSVEIVGGNHAQFGNYGRQPGDPDAQISAQEQKAITVASILEFVK